MAPGGTFSRREFVAGSSGGRRDAPPARSVVRGSGREEDLHHPAHQRHALGFHRHGSGRGLLAVHPERRHDPRRVRTSGRVDRQEEGSPPRAGPRAGARRGRLQHGDRVRRRQPGDRRRAAAHVPDGLRRHHLRQPRDRPRAGRPGPGHQRGREVRPRSGGARLEHQLLEGRRNAGRPPAPGQGRGDPPPHRDRARRHSLRPLRGPRQGGPDLHEWRCGHVRRSHRDGEGDGEGPPRDGKGGRDHRAQPRRRRHGQGRALHRRRGRRAGQGSGRRRGGRWPQPHGVARGGHRQRPHARGPDGQAGREPRRAGDLPRRRHAHGRVLPALSGRRHHCRRPRHRRRDRHLQEVGHRGRVRVARLQRRSAAGDRAAGPVEQLPGHRRHHSAGQPRHRLLEKRRRRPTSDSPPTA